MIEMKTVTLEQVRQCPKLSMLPAHFRADGTCRCNERELAEREKARAREALLLARERMAAAEEWLRVT